MLDCLGKIVDKIPYAATCNKFAPISALAQTRAGGPTTEGRTNGELGTCGGM